MSIKLTSSAFEDGGSIPAQYTCEGKDISPPLDWTGVPAEAKSLALICDDPDAPVGTWVHWVLYDVSPKFSALPEAIPTSEVTPEGAKQGVNDFRRSGYGGPCPPPGKPHRYFFKLYALDIEPGLPAGATKADLLRAMEGHILAEGQLVGLYKRG
ncbi:MAG: YbhB/YbcL family Raf kinase inhibitor-like protein [Gemmatimonadota bacterium]|nr:MAG: YbhB/YbcL family Raf kinase inhibitor-like protein [Gemmatimonadota bacterium]